MIQLFQVMETTHSMYLIMEHAGGAQLWHRIPKDGGLVEEKVCRVFRQMVWAVHYCHEKGVIHLDLKPGNFVVDARDHIKLINFGLRTSFTPGQKLNEFRGTLLYCAPEVIQGKGFEGPQWMSGASVSPSMLCSRGEGHSQKAPLRGCRSGSVDLPGKL